MLGKSILFSLPRACSEGLSSLAGESNDMLFLHFCGKSSLLAAIVSYGSNNGFHLSQADTT